MMDVIIIALVSPKSDFDVTEWWRSGLATRIYTNQTPEALHLGEEPCSRGKRSSIFCSLLPLPFPQHPCLPTNLASWTSWCMTRMAWTARRWQKPTKWVIEVKRHFYMQLASLALFRHGASLEGTPWNTMTEEQTFEKITKELWNTKRSTRWTQTIRCWGLRSESLAALPEMEGPLC